MSSNSKEAYNNVEISPEEIIALENEGTTVSTEVPKEETQENSIQEQPMADSESVESRATNPEGTSSDLLYEVEINGQTYNIDDVEKWKQDSDNKSEWSKSNTEKAQKVAKVGKFLEKFNSDSEFQEHIKMYFDDEKDFESLNLSNVEIDEPKVEQLEENPYEDRISKLEEAEQGRLIEQRADDLDRQLTNLENQYPSVLGNEEQVLEFLDFTEANSDRYRNNQGIVDLNGLFREYSFEHFQSELSHLKKLGDNKNRNAGTVVNDSEVGAKETVTPKKYKSFKDISPNDPEIAKYFE